MYSPLCRSWLVASVVLQLWWHRSICFIICGLTEIWATSSSPLRDSGDFRTRQNEKATQDFVVKWLLKHVDHLLRFENIYGLH